MLLYVIWYDTCCVRLLSSPNMHPLEAGRKELFISHDFWYADHLKTCVARKQEERNFLFCTTFGMLKVFHWAEIICFHFISHLWLLSLLLLMSEIISNWLKEFNMRRLTRCLISPPFFSHVITHGEFYITTVLNNLGVKGAIISVNAQLTLLMSSFSWQVSLRVTCGASQT